MPRDERLDRVLKDFNKEFKTDVEKTAWQNASKKDRAQLREDVQTILREVDPAKSTKLDKKRWGWNSYISKMLHNLTRDRTKTYKRNKEKDRLYNVNRYSKLTEDDKKKRVQKKKEWRNNNKERARQTQVKYRANMPDDQKKAYAKKQKIYQKIYRADCSVQLNTRRRMRRKQLLGSKTTVPVPSRHESTKYMTGFANGEDFFAILDKEFKEAYPEETDLEKALCATDEKGMAKFHLDERIPCSAFDMNPQEQTACWHYLNAQILRAEQNLKKGSKYDESDKKKLLDDVFQFYKDHSEHAWEVANRNILCIKMVEKEWNEEAQSKISEWVSWYESLNDDNNFATDGDGKNSIKHYLI